MIDPSKLNQHDVALKELTSNDSSKVDELRQIQMSEVGSIKDVLA